MGSFSQRGEGKARGWGVKLIIDEIEVAGLYNASSDQGKPVLRQLWDECLALRRVRDLAIAYHDACESFDEITSLLDERMDERRQRVDKAWRAFDKAVREIRENAQVV